MKEAGLSEPEFEFSSFFTVTLRKKAMIKVLDEGIDIVQISYSE